MSNNTGPDTVECVNCGTHIRKHAKRCHQCGVDNEKRPGREVPTGSRPKGPEGSIERSIRYPISGPDGLETVIIGGILSYISFLIVPVFAVLGYALKVLEYSARGIEEPPKFGDFGSLIVDGVKLSIVAVAYAIIPLLLILISAIVAGSGGGRGALGSVLGGVGVVGVLLSFAAAIGLYYIVPAALTNMAVEGQISDAFDLSVVKKVVLSPDYLVAWLIPFGLGILLNIVVGILWITLIGLVLVPFLTFYIQIVSFYLFGNAYREARSDELFTEDSGETVDSPQI